MARLSYRKRQKLSTKSFALPGRRFPIDTENRARNALARVAQFGSPQEKTVVRKKVSARYPGIAVSGLHKSRGRKRFGRKAAWER